MNKFSFSEFADKKDTEKLIKETAQIISEMPGNPEEILSNIIEGLDEGVLNTLWKGISGAVGGAAQGVAQGAQQWRQESQLKADQQNGPLAKFNNAVKILQDLEQELRKNPATARVGSQNLPKRSVAGYIQTIWKALQKEQGSMPQMRGNTASPKGDPTKYVMGRQIKPGARPQAGTPGAARPQAGAPAPAGSQPAPQAAAPQVGAPS